jgi:CDP-diacylglycerol---serine O-phosphatidyltransferase
MKKHIPNLITSLNLAVGCVGILYVLTENRSEAFYFVMIAAVFDFLDGFAARLLKVKSEIGKQLDSLADLVSFGLLPSFFLLEWMREDTPYFYAAILIAVFSALRLAKFNVDDSQTDSFKGLPTPANAIMITSLVFLPFELYWWTLLSICLLSAMLLVSPVRLLALKFSSFSWKGNESRWVLIFGSLVLLMVFKWTFLPLLIPFYLLVSIVSYVFIRNSD